MDNIPNADQWKLEGNCLICRRREYCNTLCSAIKKKRKRIIEQAYRDVLAEKLKEKSNTNEEN